MRFIPTRFSIRGLLLLAALVAFYSGWRLHISESHTVNAIEHAGGHVLSGYNYLLVLIDDSGQPVPILSGKAEPKRTFSELAFGDSQKRCVHFVELPLESFTPALIDKISALRRLRFVKAVVHQDPWADFDQRLASTEATKLKFKDKLAELETRFGERFGLKIQ